MINVFISVPMRDRKKEDIEFSIRKMKRIARAHLAENKEEEANINFINTIVKDNPPKEVAEKIWYLGASIQLLSKADYLITIADTYCYPGCEIERETFVQYKGYEKIIAVPINYILSDSEKEGLLRKLESAECKCTAKYIDDSDCIKPEDC